MNIFKKIQICSDLQQLIEYHYWRGEFNQVVQSINEIKYTTSTHGSNIPTRPIIIQATVIYVPNFKRLYRYVGSYSKDNTRTVRDINFSVNCKNCDFQSQMIQDITLSNGVTVPIWRFNNYHCLKCFKKRRELGQR